MDKGVAALTCLVHCFPAFVTPEHWTVPVFEGVVGESGTDDARGLPGVVCTSTLGGDGEALYDEDW